MVKVTVVIPCYNAEKYITDCLNSVVNQTIGIENLQIVLVNDASVDGTWEILQKFEQRFPESILIINLPENRKQGGARNVGLSYATGKYIAFLDADDWVDNILYEKLYNIAEQYHVEIIQYPIIKYYNGITKIEDPALIKGLITLEDDEMRKLFLVGQALTCGSQTKFYQRKFVEKVGSRFVERKVYEEPSFVYPLLFYVKVVYCSSEALYYYRIHEKSTMHEYVRIPRKLYEHAEVQLQIIQDLKKKNELFQKFMYEIEYYFVFTYYIETLYFAGKCGLLLENDYFHIMQKTVKEEFPNYKDNPYLHGDFFEYEKALRMIDKKVTQEELHHCCKNMVGEVG